MDEDAIEFPLGCEPTSDTLRQLNRTWSKLTTMMKRIIKTPPVFPTAGPEVKRFAKDDKWCSYTLGPEDREEPRDQNCTIAAAAHIIHAWLKLARGIDYWTSELVVSEIYAEKKLPNRNCVPETIFSYWHDEGIAGHKIEDCRPVGGSFQALHDAINMYGACYLDITLPEYAIPSKTKEGVDKLRANGWGTPPPGTPTEKIERKEKYRHAVAAVGYDRDYIYVVTWGCLITMTYEFYSKYHNETYVLLSQDWVNDNGVCPGCALSMAQLKEDFRYV